MYAAEEEAGNVELCLTAINKTVIQTPAMFEVTISPGEAQGIL